MERKQKDFIVTVKLYGATDSHGNTCIVPCEEACDTIQMYGIRDVPGNYIHFESDTYHLETWCEIHGLKYHHFTKEITLKL